MNFWAALACGTMELSHFSSLLGTGITLGLQVGAAVPSFDEQLLPMFCLPIRNKEKLK